MTFTQARANLDATIRRIEDAHCREPFRSNPAERQAIGEVIEIGRELLEGIEPSEEHSESFCIESLVVLDAHIGRLAKVLADHLTRAQSGLQA